MSAEKLARPHGVKSWITSKATKGVDGVIAGRGVRAELPIRRGEIVAVKGGHIASASIVADLPVAIRNSAFQIADDHYLAALDHDEYEDVMMLINHSCDPNVGMGGNILLVCMVDVPAGEELVIDYALFLGEPAFEMECQCGAARCRKVIRGTDWTNEELQQRYRGWFSWWLQRKFDEPSTSS